MDLNHPLLQTTTEPAPFPDSFPHFRRVDRAVLCPICKELFKAPVSIGCGHSFCSACIRSSLDVVKKCPSCSEPAKEGSIRRNRALEEMTDAWEAARPPLLELCRPRKRERERGHESGSGGSSPTKRRRVEEDEDDIEILGDSHDGEGELSENDDAPCPICNALMPIAGISNHIDRGCPPPPKSKAGPSGSGNQKADWRKVFAGASGSGPRGKGPEMKRIVKPNYSLTGLSELRGLLSEHGLPTSGDRALLESRYQEWTVMYNANLDTSHPSSMPALRAQLATSEAARKRDKEKGKDANVEALKTKEGFKQHVKEQQSEFERLRQDILERRKKGKHGGAVDTAIEVE